MPRLDDLATQTELLLSRPLVFPGSGRLPAVYALSGYEISRYREIAGSPLRSDRGFRLGDLEKVECLGSGADTKTAANVPNVCPDCVRRQNEEFSDLICS